MSNALHCTLLLACLGLIACTMDKPAPSSGSENNSNMPKDTSVSQTDVASIRIRVGATSFPATLVNSPAATAFVSRLPLTLSMQELNANEKFAQLPTGLPTDASNPGTIRNGDLMLYGSTTLVLFYKTFPTSYSYTKLGRVNNPAGLAAALGARSVTVTFELK
jgi:hypothetical protein